MNKNSFIFPDTKKRRRRAGQALGRPLFWRMHGFVHLVRIVREKRKKERVTMNENFKFSELEYVRPDFDGMAAKGKEILQKVRTATDFATVKACIEEMEAEEGHLLTQATIASIRHTIDVSDAFYDRENKYVNQEFPKLMAVLNEIGVALVESPFAEDIEREFGAEYLEGTRRSLKSFTPENIPLMQREAELTDEYESLCASAKIPFRGEEYNLYGIQKLFTDPDRETRKQAYKAYSDFYRDNEEKMERIFDELIRLRNQMGKNLGFANFVPLGYLQQGRSDYGPEEVAAFRAQVKEVLVPFCEKIYLAQAKRIGVDKVMAYDEKFVFPDGNAVPKGDRDFLVAQAKKMYEDLSPETAEFIHFMIDHELFDLDNKPNKANTGYMTSLPDYKAPFVFSCFNHTTFDVEVLTHEFGHALAGYLAERTQPLLSQASCATDIAEIHSMSMEQFAYPYAELFFGEDAQKYRIQHLQQAFTFVPFGVAVDEFQHIVYEHPELTPRERTYEWHKLEEKYMPWRTYEDDEFFARGGFWYHKLHIFLYPFYYINYTLTTMGAMEFKKKFEADRAAAMRDYIALCKAGGSTNYLSLLKIANLSVPFAEGSVQKACDYGMKELLKEIGE